MKTSHIIILVAIAVAIGALLMYSVDFSTYDTIESAKIIEKFEAITGIEERRYASSEINCSDMATEAARLAIIDAGCNPVGDEKPSDIHSLFLFLCVQCCSSDKN